MFERNIITKALFMALFFTAPSFVRADIQVTEIAWMGTAVSANDEWIEIHNSGSDSVSLSGWTLSAADGTPSITLSGTIGAGEYKLLERTDDTTYPGITALQTFTGALGNEGESLSLMQSGTSVQEMSFAGGWPAGEVTTKKTMQWTGSAWITATPTAGSATTSSQDEDPVEEEEEEQEEEVDDETPDEDLETEVADTSESSRSRPKRTVYEDMIFEIDFPSRAIAGVPAEFSAEALDFDRSRLRKGKYIFNMGDGTIRTFGKDWNGDMTGKFSHTYEYPGTYQISIQYYITAFEDAPPDVDDSFAVEVSAPNVSISKVHSDGSIELKNNSSATVDISGWMLNDTSGRKYMMPHGSAIVGGKSSVYLQKMTRLQPYTGVTLQAPNGALVATSITPKPISKSISASSKKVASVSVEGQVLGASVALAEATTSGVGVPTPTGVEKKDQNTLVFVLLFIILVLVSVIAVMFLRKEEAKEGYLLIED